MLLSIKGMQAELSISRPTAQRLIDWKIISSIRIGRAIRIPRSAILEFIARGGERHIQAQEAK